MTKPTSTAEVSPAGEPTPAPAGSAAAELAELMDRIRHGETVTPAALTKARAAAEIEELHAAAVAEAEAAEAEARHEERRAEFVAHGLDDLHAALDAVRNAYDNAVAAHSQKDTQAVAPINELPQAIETYTRTRGVAIMRARRLDVEDQLHIPGPISHRRVVAGLDGDAKGHVGLSMLTSPGAPAGTLSGRSLSPRRLWYSDAFEAERQRKFEVLVSQSEERRARRKSSSTKKKASPISKRLEKDFEALKEEKRRKDTTITSMAHLHEIARQRREARLSGDA